MQVASQEEEPESSVRGPAESERGADAAGVHLAAAGGVSGGNSEDMRSSELGEAYVAL